MLSTLWHMEGPLHCSAPSLCPICPAGLHSHHTVHFRCPGKCPRSRADPGSGQRTHLCRPALRPRCGHSCSDPKGFGDSPSGPALHLHTLHHPSTQAPSLGQIWPLQGRPVAPHSPVLGRPPQHHAGPIHRHTRSPSAHCATPPAGLHIHGGPRPGAATLGGQTGASCEAAVIRRPLSSIWIN